MSEINRNEELELEEMEEVSGGVYKDGSIIVLEYTVVRGDRLGAIARKYNTTIKSIMKLNPIIKDKNLIVTGWKLIIHANEK